MKAQLMFLLTFAFAIFSFGNANDLTDATSFQNWSNALTGENLHASFLHYNEGLVSLETSEHKVVRWPLVALDRAHQDWIIGRFKNPINESPNTYEISIVTVFLSILINALILGVFGYMLYFKKDSPHLYKVLGGTTMAGFVCFVLLNLSDFKTHSNVPIVDYELSIQAAPHPLMSTDSTTTELFLTN